MTSLSVQYFSPSELSADPRNARTHSQKQIGQIATSIERFGFNNPILIDKANQVVAGHGRLEASRKLGLEAVPAIRLDHLSQAQRKAYIIADNRLAELAGWDDEILAIELQGLLEMDLDFEITDLGFAMGEIDLVIGENRVGEGSENGDQYIASLGELAPIARPGDLWQLGAHRLFCGDALDPASYQVLLDSNKAQLIFTDPPYNVPISGHVSGLGKARHREFVQASGEMSPGCFRTFSAVRAQGCVMLAITVQSILSVWIGGTSRI
ncbi:ParB/Srx family N-terminal domain-containing protein [Qipengyuania atrilutea]|uniref:ParB/Srx family N-terminal domain-containing protein n=1 Tax=Qipengyuania atrilutea TaxID=2744473 RepID=UPI001C3C5859|nr:ParB/Srx family N-terminal domain-containing protein [Actirhodobacter atriluteus]